MQSIDEPSLTLTSVFLEQWEWYRALPVPLRTNTLQEALLKTFNAGDYVARAGDPSNHWYGAIDGFLQMYVVNMEGAETTLSCIRKNEWGGEGSLLKKELRQYDLRALTTSRICMLPVQTFDALRERSIEFNHFLCDIMNARMGEFVGMLAAARLGSPEMQLAKALLMLVDPRGEALQELGISQHELALISGLSRQRVNVAVSVFKGLAIVRSAPRKGMLEVHVPRLREHVRSEMFGGPAPVNSPASRSLP